MNDSENITLVFLRAPLLGEVKTRLAKSLSDKQVLELYKGFMDDTIDEVSKVSDVLLYCYPKDKTDFVSERFNNQYNVLPQSGVDIGEKMDRAFKETFSNGHEKVVLIGTDIPLISDEIMLRSFEMLDRYDSVIGPSEDGGYYLIGFRADSFESGFFENIKWSTPDVYKNTIDILSGRDKTIYKLPKLNDIDTIDDLKDLILSGVQTGVRTCSNLLKIRERLGL